MTLCVCGSGVAANECCLGYFEGSKKAPTAEALMRSRYAAYVLGHIDYLEKTSGPEVLKEFNRLDAERFSKEATWQGLEIKRVVDGGEQDDTGIVEFVFRYTYHGEPAAQHERAHFFRENGAWFYKDSEINPKAPPARVVKVGRNDPCPCGSGKKYKKCCAD